jgi:hypothetical protein
MCGLVLCCDEGASYGCAKFTVFFFLSHIFSQASKTSQQRSELTVVFKRNKDTVNTPLHIEETREHALCCFVFGS